MVALDLTDMDSILLNYVSYLCQIWNIEQLYVTHNIKQSKLYNLYEDFLKEDLNIEDIVERELERSISENYTSKVPHTVIITSDDYTESMLTQLAKDYAIDIVIVGNKSELKGTGALHRKLVRMLDTQLLLIPEEANHHMRKALIPIDFSSNSYKAFEWAQHLLISKNSVIEALNVYNIPSFYFPYIDTEKAIDKTKTHLHSRFEHYKKKHKLSDDVVFRHIDREEDSVSEVIDRTAKKDDFDIILLSARGGNTITSLFIGSITSDLLIKNKSTPLLVVQ